MSTIYVQYINGNSKISINIKVNHFFKKKGLTNELLNQLMLNQLIEQKLWQEKCFGVRFVTLKSDRERKINSKPRFENELELSLARSCLRPAQRFYMSNGCAGQKRDSNRTF